MDRSITGFQEFDRQKRSLVMTFCLLGSKL